MSRRPATTLHAQVQGALRAEIVAGRLAPGAELPSETELCRRFQVSRLTAMRALNDLAAAGLIVRGQGRRSRVLGPTPRPTTASRFVQFLMRIEGHLFSPLHEALLRRSERAGLVGVTRCDRSLAEPGRWDEVASFAAAATVILASEPLWPFLDRHAARLPRPVYILDAIDGRSYPGLQVLSDRAMGLERVVEAAIAGGHRPLHLWWWNHEPPPSEAAALERGMAVARAAGVPITLHRGFIGAGDEAQDIARAHGLLAQSPPGAAVLCPSDYVAMHVLFAARALGRNIPDDLGICGWFDTPWSRSLGLDTVAVEEDALAAAAIAAVHDDGTGRVLVAPRLVRRGSLHSGR